MSDKVIPNPGPKVGYYPAVPGWHIYQVQAMQWSQQGMDYANNRALTEFNLACQNWTANALHFPPAAKLPKPQQPEKQKVEFIWNPDRPESIDAGTSDLYIVQESDGLLGEPCPDLPAPPPAGTVHVGVHLLGTDYWQCFADDSAPVGTVTTAPDGTQVMKLFLASFSGWHGIYKIASKVTEAELQNHP